MNLRPGTDAAPWLFCCIMPCFQDIYALFLGFQGIMPWSALQFHFLKLVTLTCRSPNGIGTLWIKSLYLAPFVHLSAKKFPPLLIAWNLKKLNQLQVPPSCLHPVGLISIMKKYYYYMDTLWHMFSTLHHICKRSKQTQHTLCHNTSTLSCNCASIWHNLFIDNNNCSGPDFHHQLDNFGFSIYCTCEKAKRVLYSMLTECEIQ